MTAIHSARALLYGGSGGGGSSTPELPTSGATGSFLQKLADGVRWTDIADGGNAMGVDQSVIPLGAFVFPDNETYDNEVISFSF